MTSHATRRTFMKSALLASAPLLAASAPHAIAESPPTTTTGKEDRKKWLAIVEQVSQPLLEAISQQKLRATMPVECAKGEEEASRNSTHLQAVGRLLCGLAPWLEAEPGNDPAEEALRTRYREWARLAIRYGCDPKSPDALNFGNNQQSVVDAAFLALAIVRAPNELWGKLDSTTKDNLTRAMVETRKVQPGFNNWLLFSAIIEAMFCKYGLPWDTMRIDYALRQHQQWYKGDGLYGDGPSFHWDYYNSFVIQPMLLNVLDCVKATRRWEMMRTSIEARAVRYAAIQERLISPEGTFPAIGRSLSYRYGAFQHLAEMALRRQLPEGVTACAGSLCADCGDVSHEFREGDVRQQRLAYDRVRWTPTFNWRAVHFYRKLVPVRGGLASTRACLRAMNSGVRLRNCGLSKRRGLGWILRRTMLSASELLIRNRLLTETAHRDC